MSLMNAEADTGAQDPQTLDRVSLQGTANEVLRIDVGYDAIRAAYLQCFPAATLTMSLGDFAETAAGALCRRLWADLYPDKREFAGSGVPNQRIN